MNRPPPRVAPTLHTKRLTLRNPAIADFEASAALWSDPIVVRYIGGRPLSREEVWSRLLRYAGLWALLGYGYWSIVETATGRFAGEIGFADYERAIVPSLANAPEGGWVLAPWTHGHGYASEALEAILHWADRDLDATRTVCIIQPGNGASIRLAERFGYAAYAQGDDKGVAMTLFERERQVPAPPTRGADRPPG